MTRVVTFDAAGTLIRLIKTPGATYAECATPFGYRLDPDKLQSAFRSAWKLLAPPEESTGPRSDDDRGWWKELVRRALFNAGYTLAPFDDYFENVYARFAEAGVWELFPGTSALLSELKQRGMRLGVISNFDRRLYAVLRHLEVLERFEQVVISSEIGAYKPSPRIFLETAKRFGVRPQEMLHVGDDAELDEKGALSAGLKSCLINHERHGIGSVLDCLSGLTGRC